MSENDVIVVGYPKSGNTWLSRLLGDILDCPVTGIGSAHPLAEEGLDRKSRYTVRQLHLLPTVEIRSPNFDAWEYSIPSAQGEKLILIQRNPLDVIVSAYHYWNIETMSLAIDAVLFGRHPLKRVGPWEAFYERWADAMFLLDVYYVQYEILLKDTQTILIDLLKELKIEHDLNRILPSIERQSFANRKSELEQSGDKYNYGSTIQTKNLRHGQSGDWKTEMTPEQVAYVKQNLARYNAKAYGF